MVIGTKKNMNDINQKKYEEVVTLLKEIHEVIVIALGMSESKDIINMRAMDIIKVTIEDMELLDGMSEEDKIKIDKAMGISNTSNMEDKNDVLVFVDEVKTKGILQ